MPLNAIEDELPGRLLLLTFAVISVKIAMVVTQVNWFASGECKRSIDVLIDVQEWSRDGSKLAASLGSLVVDAARSKE